jgi:biotin transport system substrate-specific component
MTTANAAPAAPAANIAAASRPIGVKIAAALAGSLAVAAAAQVSVPLPGTTVPMTLQPLAVLVVGGLLGARFGALSLVAYLAMGVAGLPVFTPGGLPGAARLFGPTGGFLLAYPVAAAVTGMIAARARGVAASFLAPLAGLAIVFAGGLAQLTIITGDARAAVALGALPFLAKDLLSVVVAGLLIRRFLPVTRALS